MLHYARYLVINAVKLNPQPPPRHDGRLLRARNPRIIAQPDRKSAGRECSGRRVVASAQQSASPSPPFCFSSFARQVLARRLSLGEARGD